MNLARAVGPAVAGPTIARVGVAAVFALNAATFAAFAQVLPGLPRDASTEKMLPERFAGALIAGARYVRHAPPVRRMLLRILLFVGPGAALWALLPLVANQLLGLDASGLRAAARRPGDRRGVRSGGAAAPHRPPVP